MRPESPPGHGAFVFRTSLDISSFGACGDFSQAQCFRDFVHYHFYRAAAGLNLQERLRVAAAPGLIEFAKLFPTAEQRTLSSSFIGLRVTTLPQFFDRSIQKNGWHAEGPEQRRVLLFRKSPAPERHHPRKARAQLFQHFAQRSPLGLTERFLSRITENISNAAAFPPLDALVQIFEDPIQVLPQSLAHGALARTHEPNQKNRRGRRPAFRRRTRLGRTRPPRAGRSLLVRKRLARPLRALRFLFRCYLSVRFLR